MSKVVGLATEDTFSQERPYWADSLDKARAAFSEKRKLKGKVKVGSYGVTLNYDDPDPSNPLRRRFYCPSGHRWYAIPRFGKAAKKWEPPCPICMHSRHGARFVHEQLFPKGTKALYHTRHPDQRHKVAIECRDCFAATGEVKFVFDLILRRYTNGLILVLALIRWLDASDADSWGVAYRYATPAGVWNELCPDCRIARGSLLRLTEDRVQENGVVICFSEEDDNGIVPVFYPDCEHLRPTDRATALAMHARQFSDVCRDCNYNLSRYRARKLEIGDGKERQTILDVVTAIAAVLEDARKLAPKDRQERRPLVSQPKVAARMSLGDGGEGGANQLRQKLLRWGIKGIFTDGGNWYFSLRDTVIDAIEGGETPQAVAALLWMRRARVRDGA